MIMKNNAKKNKFISVFMLLIFTGMALYLCPCDAKAASPSNELVITSAMNHDCCDGMPNCPLKERGMTGMNSFLESYSLNKTVALSEILVPQISFVDVNGISSSVSDLNEHLRVPYKHYQDPPLLLSKEPIFIRFESLLI